jgi:hypothetical protein
MSPVWLCNIRGPLHYFKGGVRQCTCTIVLADLEAHRFQEWDIRRCTNVCVCDRRIVTCGAPRVRHTGMGDLRKNTRTRGADYWYVKAQEAARLRGLREWLFTIGKISSPKM